MYIQINQKTYGLSKSVIVLINNQIMLRPLLVANSFSRHLFMRFFNCMCYKIK